VRIIGNTCYPFSPSPHAKSFVIGPAVSMNNNVYVKSLTQNPVALNTTFRSDAAAVAPFSFV
jgi:hypothetical protein